MRPRNGRFSLYLNGWASDAKDLSSARLKLTAKLSDPPDDRAWNFDARINEFPQLIVTLVRKYHKYGGGLQPGPVELVVDFLITSQFIKTENYTYLQCGENR